MATETINTTATATTGQRDLSQYDFANLEPYVHPPETKADLPWAELVTLDLEDFNRPGGKSVCRNSSNTRFTMWDLYVHRLTHDSRTSADSL